MDAVALVVVLVAIFVVMWFFWRYWLTHMRREVFRSTLSRRMGGDYQVKPARNSGWYVIALVLLVVAVILLIAGR